MIWAQVREVLIFKIIIIKGHGRSKCSWSLDATLDTVDRKILVINVLMGISLISLGIHFVLKDTESGIKYDL